MLWNPPATVWAKGAGGGQNRACALRTSRTEERKYGQYFLQSPFCKLNRSATFAGNKGPSALFGGIVVDRWAVADDYGPDFPDKTDNGRQTADTETDPLRDPPPSGKR